MSTSLTSWHRAWDSCDSYPYLKIYIYICTKIQNMNVSDSDPLSAVALKRLPCQHVITCSFLSIFSWLGMPKHPSYNIRTTPIQQLRKGICIPKSHVNLPSCFHPTHQDLQTSGWGGLFWSIFYFLARNSVGKK